MESEPENPLLEFVRAALLAVRRFQPVYLVVVFGLFVWVWVSGKMSGLAWWALIGALVVLVIFQQLDKWLNRES